FVTSFGEGTRPAATRPTKPSAAGTRRSVGRRGWRAAGSAEGVRPVVVARPPELAVRRVAPAVAPAAVADPLPPEGVAARRLPRDRELHKVARAALRAERDAKPLRVERPPRAGRDVPAERLLPLRPARIRGVRPEAAADDRGDRDELRPRIRRARPHPQ